MFGMRTLYGALALGVVALAFAFATSPETETATIEVSSVPSADVRIDGVHVGESNQTFIVDAGEHRIEVLHEGFTGYETRVTASSDEPTVLDVSLTGQNPGDPVVIAKLAESIGVDVAPFAAPRLMRGASSKRHPAVLLWPVRDIRTDGLVTYAVEADETYGDDASLEFRHGRKVLYREAFHPESITTVRSLPAEVLEHVKVGRTFTWGLYFEDRRRPIKATFRIVQRPKAERQLASMRNSRHMQRQPQITREIMAATILENNRLYSEALVANLAVATNHPASSQPYRGIVTTLRRLDAEDSELFSFVSPFVSGKGGHAGVSKPGISARSTGSVLGLAAWSPVQVATPPVVADVTSSASSARMGPGGAGVTPTDNGTSAGPSPSAKPADDTSTEATGPRHDADMTLRREQSAQAEEASRLAEDRATIAEESVEAAEAEAIAAEQVASEAEAAATAAREAVEQTDEPTAAQQQAMTESGRVAEEAREAATVAREGAEKARHDAARAAAEAAAAAEHAQILQSALEDATDTVPGTQTPGSQAPGSEAPGTAEAEQVARDAAAQAVVDAEQTVATADAAVGAAQAELEAADAARAGDPSAAAVERFHAAEAAVRDALKASQKARADFDNARRAVENVVSQIETTAGN